MLHLVHEGSLGTLRVWDTTTGKGHRFHLYPTAMRYFDRKETITSLIQAGYERYSYQDFLVYYGNVEPLVGTERDNFPIAYIELVINYYRQQGNKKAILTETFHHLEGFKKLGFRVIGKRGKLSLMVKDLH